ncbi:hypothetical protein ABW20_dc0100046 [Dactylellina cionopaga]|nr:hypothetical protein ABW20_dc0100046 [Dactylellina cionopaga]
MSSMTYSPRRNDISIASALKAATISPGRNRNARRPALIPAAAFNALESTADLSSILPDLHGLQSGDSIYILPPAPPPPELALKMKLEVQQQQLQRPASLRRHTSSTSLASEMDVDGDWTMSGAHTPVNTGLPGVAPALGGGMRRWSMKDLVDLKHGEEEEPFDTPKQYLHKRQASSVSEDLFSFVNSSADIETGIRTVNLSDGGFQGLESLPTSPMGSTTAPGDVKRQLMRLQEASKLLQEL